MLRIAFLRLLETSAPGEDWETPFPIYLSQSVVVCFRCVTLFTGVGMSNCFIGLNVFKFANSRFWNLLLFDALSSAEVDSISFFSDWSKKHDAS